jgi:hypothetical protein
MNCGGYVKRRILRKTTKNPKKWDFAPENHKNPRGVA